MSDTMKLFRMNEYDWVCAKTIDEAYDWYIKEHGLNEEDEPFDEIVECSLDETFLTSVNEATQEELNQNFTRTTLGGTEYLKIPFWYRLKHEKHETPFIAGSTEW